MTSDSSIQTIITNSGSALALKMMLGTQVTFTKIKIGDGILSGTDPRELTDLVHSLYDTGIYKKEDIDNTAMCVTTLIEQQNAGFTFREIGLFALDPDTNEEVLYAYGNKGDDASYIPSNNSNIAVEEEASMIVYVGNNTNVIINFVGGYDYFANVDLTNLAALGEKRFSDIWDELVKKASVNLDNLSSLGQAILDKKVEVEALLQQNGYAKFSWKENNEISSFIIQWGRFYESTSTTDYKNLPIAFSKKVYGVWTSTCNFTYSENWSGRAIAWAFLHSLSDILTGAGNDWSSSGTPCVYCILIGE